MVAVREETMAISWNFAANCSAASRPEGNVAEIQYELKFSAIKLNAPAKGMRWTKQRMAASLRLL